MRIRIIIAVGLVAAACGGSGDPGVEPDGATDAAVLDGPSPDGTAADGAAADGLAPDGTATDGGVADGRMQDAASVDAAMADGAVPDAFPADGAVTDGAAGDASIESCPARLPGQIGGPCSMDSDCDSAPAAVDGACLVGSAFDFTWPAEGFCLSKVGGCASDGDCGAGNVCVDFVFAGGVSACAPGCCLGATCAAGEICADDFAGGSLGGTACVPGNSAADDGDACADVGDCDEGSTCVVDALESPGGTCWQLGCTSGDDSTCTTGGDGHCIAALGSTACADVCAADADCRVAEGYRCFAGGASIGMICRHPHTGDSCSVASDCGDAAVWECKTGPLFPGGYCTAAAACPVPGTSCSPGSSVCYDGATPSPADNFCVDQCFMVGMSATCRTGYTCQDIDPGPTVTGGCVSL